MSKQNKNKTASDTKREPTAEQLQGNQHDKIIDEPLLNKIAEKIIAYLGLKDEDDYMYQKGKAKAETRLQKELEQKQRFSVIRLFDSTTLSENQIINVLEVSPAFIQAIKKDLIAAPKKIARLKKTLTAEQIAQELNLPVNWVEKHIQ
jgi:hypothetical protein